MIYIVTKGSYSCYHVVAATLDRAVAEKIAKKFSEDYEECRIEEYPDAEVMLSSLWCVYFKRSGDVWKCILSDSEYDYRRHDNVIETVYKFDYDMIVYVEADNEEAAIKIAAEKRAKYLAEKFGL